ncbi:MAG: EAL domain-containing protein [Campylobacterota bacterium]|nr:EAL domain-containing protein [Campylobacterota bacterium]
MELSIYLARQPIYDLKGNIAAYELLYRNTEKNSTSVNNHMHATARVLVNALNYIGLNNLTKGHIAFIKVDHTTILDDIIYSIAPSHFVLEILESSVISSELLKRIEYLHTKGYRFALNHFHDSPEFILQFQSLFDAIDYVKIDISETDGADAIITKLKEHNLTFIAEKIEDETHYENSKKAGCELFQGYHLAKPILFKKERVDPDSSLLIELIYLLRTNAPLDELLEKFNKSPYLTITLLKFIHLHEGLKQDTLASIEQALILIGRERLGNWLELMVYAYDKESEEEASFTKRLSEQAHQRASLMEELARRTKSSDRFAHAAYMTGLLSMAEAMFQNGYTDILKQIHVDKNIADALVKKNGELGQLLGLAIAVERNDIHTINAIIGQLYISQNELNACILASYRRN